MSVDKTETPSVAVLMPLGSRRVPTKDIIDAARHTMNSFSLPDIVWKTRPKEFNAWRKRTNLFFVREEQVQFFRGLENNIWKMSVYSNEIATHISNIREYIRRFVVSADVIINVDSDFKRATDAPHSPWTATYYHNAQMMSRTLLALVRHFDNRARTIGLMHAGVKINRPNYPNISSGISVPVLGLVSGPAYFKENLTFETSARAGEYPKNWSTKEGLYRSLFILQKFGGCGTSLGTLDTHAFMFKTKHKISDFDNDGALDKLCEIFGKVAVLQQFNQQAAGKNRNRR